MISLGCVKSSSYLFHWADVVLETDMVSHSDNMSSCSMKSRSHLWPHFVGLCIVTFAACRFMLVSCIPHSIKPFQSISLSWVYLLDARHTVFLYAIIHKFCIPFWISVVHFLLNKLCLFCHIDWVMNDSYYEWRPLEDWLSCQSWQRLICQLI